MDCHFLHLYTQGASFSPMAPSTNSNKADVKDLPRGWEDWRETTEACELNMWVCKGTLEMLERVNIHGAVPETGTPPSQSLFLPLTSPLSYHLLSSSPSPCRTSLKAHLSWMEKTAVELYMKADRQETHREKWNC